MLILLVFVCWVVAELFVAIKVAEAIGVLLTIVLLVAGWPVGSWALRTRGRAAWRRLSEAVAAGRAPGREVVDGALVLIGGLFLIVPGFITDALGLLLLLTPTRGVARRLLARNLQSRLVRRAAGWGRGPVHYDVESTATDVHTHRLDP